MYYDRAWSNYETGEAFAELMLDGGNYERIDDLVVKTLDSCLPPEERVGYLFAWLEGYIASDFFETVLTQEEVEKIDILEIARALLDNEIAVD